MSVVCGFEFKRVVLLRTRVLGVGSYGQVCEAQCDDILCAAKIIHPTLLSPSPFQLHDTNPRLPLNRFMRECALLKEIRHPNIVQYLGTCNDPDTQLPVLLMELLDQNLTTFLQNSLEPVPYYIQVNLSLDIARGLAFLHINSLVHRDLSSNNILLVGNARAKLSDFGMMKMDVSSVNTSNTNCPGTQVYMPPEAISNSSGFTSKGDVFSFGVNLVQILTRKYPKPGGQFKTVQVVDPHFPSGKVEVRVPELERRENHIGLVFPGHPLLPIARQCLRDSEEGRPFSSDLCQKITSLKSSAQYEESVAIRPTQTVVPVSMPNQQQPVGIMQDMRLEEAINAKDRQIESLRQELETSKILHKRMVEGLEQKLREKDELLEAKEAQLNIKERFLEQHESQKRDQDTLSELTASNYFVVSDGDLKLNWAHKQVAPCRLYRGTNSCVYSTNTAYFMPAFQLPWSGRVYSLDLQTLKWSGLPDSPCEFAALVMIEDQLTAVGGQSKPSLLKDLFGACSPTNKLHTLASKDKWTEVYPPMPSARFGATAVATSTSLIVIGGRIKKKQALNSVEIMDISTRQWSIASNIPTPQYEASAAICGDQLYIVGGSSQLYSPLSSVYTCSVYELTQSTTALGLDSCAGPPQEVWSVLPPLCVLYSTAVSLGNRLVVVGGCGSDYKPTTAVRMYNQTTENWAIAGRLGSPRERCFALALPGNKLLVAGGYTSTSAESYTDSVEIASIV